MRALVEDGCMIGDRWGVTDSEILRCYPCDDFVVSPALQAWRGVRVEASAEVAWPGGAQSRLSPYSYDLIHKPCRPSPPEPGGLPQPQIGERFTTSCGAEVGPDVPV